MEILSSITHTFLFVSTLEKSPSCLVPDSPRACSAGRAPPGGAADRGLGCPGSPGPALPGTGTAGCGACRAAGLPQLCRPSPALPACLFSRLGRGHKRHYRLAAWNCFSRRKSHFGNQRSGCLTQSAGLQLQVCTRSQPGSASFPGSASPLGAEGQSERIRPASQSHPRDDLSSVQCTRSGHQSLAQVTAPHQAPNPQRQTKVWSHT